MDLDRHSLSEIIEWKESAWNYLESLGYDFAILQEIYPDEKYLNGKKYWYNNVNEYGSSWGSMIIAKNINKANQHEFISTYENSKALMCCHFELENGKILTIINIYGKKDSWGYYDPILHHMLSDITPIIRRGGDHLIVVAGDFNASSQPISNYPNGDPTDKLIFNRISDLGLVNCTLEQYGTYKKTITKENSEYQDDYIFLNKQYYDKDKYKVIIHDPQNDTIASKLSDHFPVEIVLDY
jgi:hypothetical protein